MGITKKQLLICLAGFTLTVGTFLVIKTYQHLTFTSPYAEFFANGYDFRGMQDTDVDFSRLKVGETIDLGKVLTTQNTKLVIGGDFVLLAVVDPKCAFCTISSDIFAGIRDKLPKNILYVPVVLNRRSGENGLDEFGRSLGFKK